MFYDNDLKDWLTQPFAQNLTQEQFNTIANYFNDIAPFDDNDYKEVFYYHAKKGSNNFDKSIVFLTTYIEATRWTAFDTVGVGNMDLLDYQTSINTTATQTATAVKETLVDTYTYTERKAEELAYKSFLGVAILGAGYLAFKPFFDGLAKKALK